MNSLDDVYLKADELQDAVLKQNELIAESLELINSLQMGLETMIQEFKEAGNE